MLILDLAGTTGRLALVLDAVHVVLIGAVLDGVVDKVQEVVPRPPLLLLLTKQLASLFRIELLIFPNALLLLPKL